MLSTYAFGKFLKGVCSLSLYLVLLLPVLHMHTWVRCGLRGTCSVDWFTIKFSDVCLLTGNYGYIVIFLETTIHEWIECFNLLSSAVGFYLH